MNNTNKLGSNTNGIARLISEMTGIPVESIEVVQGNYEMPQIVAGMPFAMQQPTQKPSRPQPIDIPNINDKKVPIASPQKKGNIAYDIYAKEDNLTNICLELAGYQKEEIDISLENNKLVVTANRSVAGVEIVQEGIAKEKRQTIVVGDGYTIDDFTVMYQNGILSITYPKIINKSCGKIKIS